MIFKLLTEHHLEFLSLEGGCTGSSETTLVKTPHCWKSHVAAQIALHQTAPREELRICLLSRVHHFLLKHSVLNFNTQRFKPKLQWFKI